MDGEFDDILEKVEFLFLPSSPDFDSDRTGVGSFTKRRCTTDSLDVYRRSRIPWTGSSMNCWILKTFWNIVYIPLDGEIRRYFPHAESSLFVFITIRLFVVSCGHAHILFDYCESDS